MFPSTSNLVAILSPDSAAETPGGSPQAMSAGEITGIVVGIVLVSVIVAIATLYALRRHRKAAQVRIAADMVAAEASDQHYPDSKDTPQMGFKSELPTDNAVQPKEMSAESTPALSPGPSELGSSPMQPSELSTDRITSWNSRTTAAIHELPTNDIQAAELYSPRPEHAGLGIVQEGSVE